MKYVLKLLKICIINKVDFFIQYLKIITDLDDVKQKWMALEYVINQPDIICIAAVKQKGYVNNKTDEICLAAIKYRFMS